MLGAFQNKAARLLQQVLQVVEFVRFLLLGLLSSFNSFGFELVSEVVG